MPVQLDDTDRQILQILQEDSSITNVALSERVGLAPATTLERVRKLERAGVISRYVALVDADKVDMGLMAFIEVQLASHASRGVDGFQEAVSHLEQVLECYHLTGETDYMLKVVVPNIEAYESFLLEELTKVPNVGRVHTSFVLSTLKHDTRLPIR
jgi:DNA-binding Lrp family transcriptional regulator